MEEEARREFVQCQPLVVVTLGMRSFLLAFVAYGIRLYIIQDPIYPHVLGRLLTPSSRFLDRHSLVSPYHFLLLSIALAHILSISTIDFECHERVRKPERAPRPVTSLAPITVFARVWNRCCWDEILRDLLLFPNDHHEKP